MRDLETNSFLTKTELKTYETIITKKEHPTFRLVCSPARKIGAKREARSDFSNIIDRPCYIFLTHSGLTFILLFFSSTHICRLFIFLNLFHCCCFRLYLAGLRKNADRAKAKQLRFNGQVYRFKLESLQLNVVQQWNIYAIETNLCTSDF